MTSFILDEDKALKTWLAGITVEDAKNPTRPVGVWFGQPDLEIREQSFPYLTIDLIDISLDVSRRQSGILEEMYLSVEESEEDPIEIPYEYEYPLPVSIMYQISSYSRNPRHDRQIINQVLNDKIKMKYGFLYIPEDNTARRLDLLGFVKRDVVEDSKRLFINNFTVMVTSEVPVSTLRRLYEVTDVNIATQLIITQNTIPG